MYDILNEITETRIYCGFRENMNQESTKPYRRSRFKMAWLIDSWMFYPRIYEFMDAANGYDKTEIRKFMGQLIPLEYKRDKAGFQRLFEEQKEKYVKNPSVYQYHLNMILVQSFICKCDDSEAFPKEYMDEVTDYLFTVEQWQIYELSNCVYKGFICWLYYVYITME